MKQLFLTVFVSILMLLGAAQAFAGVQVHEEAGIQVTVPDDWKLDGDENSLVVLDPTESGMIVLAVVEAADLEASLDQLDEFLGQFVTDVEVADDAEEHDLNGMSAISIKGKGKVEGEDVGMLLMLVQTPTDKVLLVLGMVEASQADALKPKLKEIMTSISPAE